MSLYRIVFIRELCPLALYRQCNVLSLTNRDHQSLLIPFWCWLSLGWPDSPQLRYCLKHNVNRSIRPPKQKQAPRPESWSERNCNDVDLLVRRVAELESCSRFIIASIGGLRPGLLGWAAPWDYLSSPTTFTVAFDMSATKEHVNRETVPLHRWDCKNIVVREGVPRQGYHAEHSFKSSFSCRIW